MDWMDVNVDLDVDAWHGRKSWDPGGQVGCRGSEYLSRAAWATGDHREPDRGIPVGFRTLPARSEVSCVDGEVR